MNSHAQTYELTHTDICTTNSGIHTYMIQVRFPDEKEVTVSVSASATCDVLKTQIREATGTHEAYQRLIFQGKQLEGSDVLNEKKMVNGCVLLCQVCIYVCMCLCVYVYV